MPIQYKPTKHAFVTKGAPLTEQEHKDSCDINKMLKASSRGLQVRGSKNEPRYGFDDTTLDGVQFRIKKQELEAELSEISAKHEFSPEELEHIPPDVKKKFKFKTKKADQKTPPKNDDDKTTTKQSGTSASSDSASADQNSTSVEK